VDLLLVKSNFKFMHSYMRLPLQGKVVLVFT